MWETQTELQAPCFKPGRLGTEHCVGDLCLSICHSAFQINVYINRKKKKRKRRWAPLVPLALLSLEAVAGTGLLTQSCPCGPALEASLGSKKGAGQGWGGGLVTSASTKSKI